jgi:hypothetical protein
MKAVRISAIVLVFLVAVNALFAGYSFVTDRSGAGLGASVALLAYSPFPDFFIPGLILFSVNGVLNLVTGVLLLFKWRHCFQMLVLQGILLSGWILIQIWMLRDLNALHFIFLAIGVFFIVAGNGLRREIKT